MSMLAKMTRDQLLVAAFYVTYRRSRLFAPPVVLDESKATASEIAGQLCVGPALPISWLTDDGLRAYLACMETQADPSKTPQDIVDARAKVQDAIEDGIRRMHAATVAAGEAAA